MNHTFHFYILALSVLLLRAIKSAEYSLHCGKFDIRIRRGAKECCARGHLDLNIGYGLCFSSFSKRMFCIGEYLKIGYIILIERLYKSINGTIATAMQFARDTVNGDAGSTCNDFRATLLRYFLYME